MAIEKDHISAVIGEYNHDSSNLIMMLQDIQSQLQYLPEEAFTMISQHLQIPESQIYSVASFYQCFTLQPQGKHRVDICMGTACHVRGSGRLVSTLADHLGIQPGNTTDDKEITLNTVHCVGACAMGPVVVIDDEYHGEMTPSKLKKTIKKCGGGPTCHSKQKQTDYNGGKEKEQITPFSLANFQEIQKLVEKEKSKNKNQILICAGTGCLARGSLAIAKEFEKQMGNHHAKTRVNLDIKTTGCHGLCEKGPLVTFYPTGLFYTKVTINDVKEIVEKTVIKNEVIPRLLFKDPQTKKRLETYRSIPFYALQRRFVLSNVGGIDPEDIKDSIAHGGYEALWTVLSSWQAERVIDEIERSGLRGRGGGGFSTGRKWRSCVQAKGDIHYLICNGDEGDPGAFMDCSIMEGDPHRVIEGMILCAYAINAKEGYIYVREEYPRALKRMHHALKEARDWGILGKSIFGTAFSFDITINRGAGAFVCGESTALMQSIAGNVGEPRAKYIRSVERGLYDQPTVLNNVETFATIPLIIEKTASWFSSLGTEKSKGTKAFSIVGKVKNTGLVEVPMGTSLRTIIFDLCGGILNDKPFKAIQTGGPSGGCLPESKLDLLVDFDTLASQGSMMGSGGMIVMDSDTCMVDVARYFTEFLTKESCGKCAPCRLGLDNLKKILVRICNGEGKREDIHEIEKLFTVLENGSLCGLGKSAANPVRSTLTHFLDEYEAHINDKTCPAGVCKALIRYTITPSCTGCHRCANNCPKDAISGVKKEIHTIDSTRCDRCGICVTSCKFDAIVVSG